MALSRSFSRLPIAEAIFSHVVLSVRRILFCNFASSKAFNLAFSKARNLASSCSLGAASSRILCTLSSAARRSASEKSVPVIVLFAPGVSRCGSGTIFVDKS